MKTRIASVVLAVSAGAGGWAATYEVREKAGANVIQAAVEKAKPGDTILIHAGRYRESVTVKNGGTAEKPIVIAAAPGEDAVITGADLISSGEWRQLPGKSIWQHAPWTYSGRTHPNNEFHQLIGRTEQVILDGKLLKQAAALDRMEPGTFYAEPEKALYVWLPGGGDPSGHRIEASVRPLLMEIAASHVVVRGLRLLYATNTAQRPALLIDGSDNLVEDCIAEWTNGVGVRLAGERNVARRVTSRFNGQLGFSGHGVRNLMEECRLERNNVKGFAKGWEAGGMKAALTRQFHVRRCVAVGNDGPGIWFDIDNRDSLIEGSYTEANNGPGIFVEISETATIRNNLCVRNGWKDEKRVPWNQAGILLGEAMRCTVEHNVCVGNRNGIEVRQQRIRTLPADPAKGRTEEKNYYSDGLVFRYNIAAFNSEWQFAFYGDNAFFGAKAESAQEPPSRRDLELMDPDRRGWRSTNNLYYPAPGAGLVLWGAKWRPKHEEFDDLNAFDARHHLEQGSQVADPLFVDWMAGDYTLKPDSPAKRTGAGFTEAPVSPAFRP